MKDGGREMNENFDEKMGKASFWLKTLVVPVASTLVFSYLIYRFNIISLKDVEWSSVIPPVGGLWGFT